MRASLRDLREELLRLGRDPRLKGRKTDALFTLWFLLAYASNDNLDEALPALSGHAGDRDADAVLIDRRSGIVHVVQAKLRDKLLAHAETRDGVNAFTGFATALWGSKRELEEFCNADGMDPHARELLEQARAALVRHPTYWLNLCYITTGKFSSNVRAGAQLRVTNAGTRSELVLLDGNDILRILADYRDGVVHVRPLTLPVRPGASGGGIQVRSEAGVTAWVLTMSAFDVAQLMTKAGPSLFARNIRGFLGAKTDVNNDLATSVTGHPELFWFLNNGVTILASKVERTGGGSDEGLLVTDAQIINGQQTTRTLHDVAQVKSEVGALRQASVLVRVIEVPPAGPASESFDEFVSSVVQATNWQNKIEASDLRSNDRRQVSLQRELRVLGYEYLRKRERKGEVRRQTRGLRVHFISKFDLAEAVAGCDLEYLPLRVGKEPLFTGTYYSRVFPKDDPYYYLTRYWVAEAVRQRLRGSGERRSMRWPITYFVWLEVRSVLQQHADRFEAQVTDRESSASVALTRLTLVAYKAFVQFYTAHKRVDGEIRAVDDFFKRDRILIKGSALTPHAAFMSHWRSSANKTRRSTFDRGLTQLRDALAGRS